MQSYIYHANVHEIAASDFELRFRDVPEVITGGSTAEAALAEAADALAAGVEGYLKLGLEVPRPSAAAAGEHAVALDPVLAARVALGRAITEQGLTGVALAHRLDWDEKAVRRVLSGRAASADKILHALCAVGLQPALSVIGARCG